jgi:hypothetical protein
VVRIRALAQRVRATRGPMTGSGVTHHFRRVERWWVTAAPDPPYALMIGSWAVTFAFMVALGRIEEGWRKRKLQDLLDHVATEV